MKEHKVSNMIRMTSENSVKALTANHEFLMQVADHIDHLENTIAELNQKISELTSDNNEA
jgi:ubiquinone biosynthesis protein UbiJ